jgi:hypothetical protein
MKTIESHIQDLETYNQVNDPPMLCLSPIALRATMKEIRLEALREGMEMAAGVASKMQESPYTSGGWINKAILSAAEQLTEKDLGNFN